MPILSNTLAWYKNLKPLPFVLFTTVFSLLATMPLAILIQVTGTSQQSIGGPGLAKMGWAQAILLAVVIAPLIETWLGQALPIRFVQWINPVHTGRHAMLISSILFSLAHLSYSWWYVLLVWPTGLALAATYWLWRQRMPGGFWMAFFVHALRNLLSVVVAMAAVN